MNNFVQRPEGKRPGVMLTLFILLLLVGIYISISYGAVEISLGQIWFAITEATDDRYSLIIHSLRLPRTLVGMMVGANLSVVGALLQGVMKNPLADPYAIGISSGAALAAYVSILLFPQFPQFLLPGAFIGASLVAFIVYVLAWNNGISPVRLILSGVAISSFLGAWTSTLSLFYSDRLHGAIAFMVGGLAAVSWQEVWTILPYSLIGMTVALGLSRSMNLLSLGDASARGLGLPVERIRIFATLTATLLTASSVAVVGLLGFVGLVVPHIVRLTVGEDYHYLLPGSLILGMAVILICDTFGRVAFAPIELPVSIIMGVIGGPFFLYLLRKGNI